MKMMIDDDDESISADYTQPPEMFACSFHPVKCWSRILGERESDSKLPVRWFWV